MAQREVSDGEILRAAWQAEDRHRGQPMTAPLLVRELSRGRRLGLFRSHFAHHLIVMVDERAGAGDDVYDFKDGDAAWRAALGWNGRAAPKAFTYYRRRP